MQNVVTYFNSHPHEEDDNETWVYGYLSDISTHILTKRMTWTSLLFICIHLHISTHILTKRMTRFRAYVTSYRQHFNSHPHEEDDDEDGFETSLAVFQLTSSRRGWQRSVQHRRQRDYFNSHPHEEDDKNRTARCWSKKISTHILTKRMTTIKGMFNEFGLFQLTSSRRGWRAGTQGDAGTEISTHILTKRMTEEAIT